VFRNEGVSTRHNPEFTSVEVYQSYADYSDMMDLTEALLRTAALAVRGDTRLQYAGVDIDLGLPFRRVTMNELVQEKTGGLGCLGGGCGGGRAGESGEEGREGVVRGGEGW
jgi:lysyl-tRNA synthetase class 2